MLVTVQLCLLWHVLAVGDLLSQRVGAEVLWCMFVFSFEVAFSLLVDVCADVLTGADVVERCLAYSKLLRTVNFLVGRVFPFYEEQFYSETFWWCKDDQLVAGRGWCCHRHKLKVVAIHQTPFNSWLQGKSILDWVLFLLKGILSWSANF